MSPDSIFILASGFLERWKAERPKQLVEIGGEILLRRIQRQTGDRSIVVTHRESIQALSTRWISVGLTDPITATLLATHPYWVGRVVVLLGDVIYSDPTMERILSCDLDFATFGRRWEIFALSFDSETRRESVGYGVRWACNAAMQYHEAGKAHAGLEGWEQRGRGKLWELYRLFCGLPIDQLVLEHDVFQLVRDLTDDIDTIEEYYEFLDKNPWADTNRNLEAIGCE